MNIPKLNIPRWFIFVIDSLLALFSISFAYMLRFNFNIPSPEIKYMQQAIIIIMVLRMLSFLLAKTYAGIIRYTSTYDAFRIIIVNLITAILLAIANPISNHYFIGRHLVPYSIIIIDLVLATMLMIFLRLLVKMTYMEIKSVSKKKKNAIIYGAGQEGMLAKEALSRDAGASYNVIAFVDANRKNSGKKIEGVTIHNIRELSRIMEINEISLLILADSKISRSRKETLINLSLKKGIQVMSVPPVSHWVDGVLSFSQIRKVKIEDLLGREEIKLNEDELIAELKDKKVMITGAAGSIGSELVRQLIRFQPSKLILIDQAETPLFHLELESFRNDWNNCCLHLADITDKERMRRIFEEEKPDYIFHAAAYKHVPVMESNPIEAYKTNICGTRNLADLSIDFGVEKFVMISTDKAVKPTNVMGASKRIAEIYTQSLDKEGSTRFITTRFGNVLGSNGSVIPLFRKQIEAGGPITITHPEITRFFMTIPEACQLVLQAGAIGKGGEIFVFDMGESVKIKDLASKMLQLAGLEEGKDIKIKYTGLRPGEKLYEELLNESENTLPTHHEKILKAQIAAYPAGRFRSDFEALDSLAASGDLSALISKFKEMVPEYISQNSPFEQLDKNS